MTEYTRKVVQFCVAASGLTQSAATWKHKTVDSNGIEQVEMYKSCGFSDICWGVCLLSPAKEQLEDLLVKT